MARAEVSRRWHIYLGSISPHLITEVAPVRMG
jgi:hypothetical protein